MVPVTEKEFQSAVIAAARALGWRCAHFRTALNSRGQWLTPVQADGAGFPDLILVRGKRIIAAELKVARGRVSAEQEAWLEAFRKAGALAPVWRPSDWPEIERELGAA
jgi:hypothetical protein